MNLLDKVEQCRATVLPIVPTIVTMFSTFLQKLTFDLTSVKKVTSTAERLKLDNINTLKTLFPNAQVFSMYGLTECKRCTYVPPHKLEEKRGSVGKAIPNTEIRIIDQNNHFCLPHQEGEMVIRGANVMRGYWKKPEETEKSFFFDELGNKWLRSGDYGYIDGEGYFFLQGRCDSVVKVRGMKVSLLEVEEILSRCPIVKEVVLINKCELDQSEKIIAFAATSDKNQLSEIHKYCREYLRDHQIPSEVHILESIPKNINGKIDRQKLMKYL
jgi:acyl-coenzyme A synthetase/AMP-(fatty) acid ligase